MGRVKSVAIKSLGDKLIEENGGKFSSDFDNNKKVLGEARKIESKRTRNILAGYISNRMQKVKKSGI